MATLSPTSLFTARELCELALRKVGAYSRNDASADPNDLVIALDFMELEISNLAGGDRAQWLVPETVEFALTANTASFVLETIAGAAFPDLKIAYPIEASVATGSTLAYDAQTGNFTLGLILTGGTSGATATIVEDSDAGTTGTLTLLRVFGTFADNEVITDSSTGSATVNGTLSGSGDSVTPIDLIRREEYESIPDKTTSGTPNAVHIDRLVNEDKNLFVYPVPTDALSILQLVVMTYPRTVRTSLADQAGAGDITHGFDRVFQKWCVLATARQIGDGPCRQLKSEKLDRIEKETTECLKILQEKYNRERISTRLHRTKRWDGGSTSRGGFRSIWKH